MANPFTTARLALWAAIDHWPALNPGGVSVFARKKKRDGDARLIPAATGFSVADMAAIDIRPNASPIEWDVARAQKVNYQLAVIIVALKLPKLEQLVFDTWEAIYQAKEFTTDTIGYVRAATGYNPLNLQVTWQQATEQIKGKTLKAEQATMVVGLRFQKDPFSATS